MNTEAPEQRMRAPDAPGCRAIAHPPPEPTGPPGWMSDVGPPSLLSIRQATGPSGHRTTRGCPGPRGHRAMRHPDAALLAIGTHGHRNHPRLGGNQAPGPPCWTAVRGGWIAAESTMTPSGNSLGRRPESSSHRPSIRASQRPSPSPCEGLVGRGAGSDGRARALLPTPSEGLHSVF